MSETLVSPRISPLRRRMIEDMTVRQFVEKTQGDYIRHVRTFTAFLGRSPDTATADDLRRFQLHQAGTGVRPPSINSAVAALRFFFTVTLDRPELARGLVFVREPRKIPVVLSPEEVARLLEVAPGPKYKAALSAAYGAGLRIAEVANLKVSDVESKRMLLRIEQGKGRKDRFAMLSERLLELLRDWYRIARPPVWLFCGRDPMLPVTTRQLNRAFPAAATMAGIKKRVKPHTLRHSFATHLIEQNIDIRVIQVLPRYSGAARPCQVGDDGALRAGGHHHHPQGDEPARPAVAADRQGPRAAGVIASSDEAAGSRGRGHLPRSRGRVAQRQRRPPEPRPVAGDERDRALPYRGARRPRRRLRAVRAHAGRLQQLPQPALPEVPGSGGEGMAGRARGRAAAGALLSPGLHPAGSVADIARQNKAVVYDPLFRAASETLLTIAADPKHLGARIGIAAVLHTWGSALTHHPHPHIIVPGGGLSPDGGRWISCRPGFFPPVRVLAKLFRRRMLERLAAAHAAGQLAFFGAHAPLAGNRAFAAFLAPLKKTKWFVYSKRPFAGPAAVLAYLARYTHRVAIANSRLIALDDAGVTFKWKDYRADGRARLKTMTLAPPEFIRRFLPHVLPTGFHRIRHYGLYANGQRRDMIARARQLLDAATAESAATERTDNNDEAGETAATPTQRCPCCGGRMIVVETFAAGTAPRHRPSAQIAAIRIDTS